jgi:hypothetical protein
VLRLIDETSLLWTSAIELGGNRQLRLGVVDDVDSVDGERWAKGKKIRC